MEYLTQKLEAKSNTRDMFSDLMNIIFNHVYIHNFVVLIVGVIGKSILSGKRLDCPSATENSNLTCITLPRKRTIET